MTGQEIRALRKKLGMTQQEFANALGVSRVSVSDWERGVTPPSRLAERELARLKGGWFCADCGTEILVGNLVGRRKKERKVVCSKCVKNYKGVK